MCKERCMLSVNISCLARLFEWGAAILVVWNISTILATYLDITKCQWQYHERKRLRWKKKLKEVPNKYQRLWYCYLKTPIRFLLNQQDSINGNWARINLSTKWPANHESRTPSDLSTRNHHLGQKRRNQDEEECEADFAGGRSLGMWPLLLRENRGHKAEGNPTKYMVALFMALDKTNRRPLSCSASHPRN